MSRAVVPFLLACLLILTAAPPALADAPPPLTIPAQAALAALRRHAIGDLDIQWRAGPKAQPSFLTGRIPVETRDPAQAARSFFRTYAPLYGIRDPERELEVAQVERDALEMDHVRLRQVVGGVPIFGAEMVVHLRDGEITAVNGHFFPDIDVVTTPAIPQARALAIVRADLGDPGAEFREERSGLVVYAGSERAHLAWQVTVISWHELGSWLYFIDVLDGHIIYRLNQLADTKALTVWDAHNNWTLPGDPLCGAGTANPTCVDADAAAQGAFSNGGKVYDFYKNTFGFLSYDGADSPVRSTVHYGTGYRNAFWNGYQMVYGDGDRYAELFDIVAHEFAHGVTQHTSDLVYEHQSGALSESWSDVMAALAGCSPHTGMADCDWYIGEDLSGGMIRNLAHPTLLGHPDHWDDYVWLPIEDDNGGVHSNCGIPNKAAHLLTMGGIHHDVIVSGIGYTRTEQTYFRAAAHYLTPYADFADARSALVAACQDFIGNGYSQAHCDSVANAWAAVGIGEPVAAPGPRKVYLPWIARGYPLPPYDTTSILSYGGFESGYAYLLAATL